MNEGECEMGFAYNVSVILSIIDAVGHQAQSEHSFIDANHMNPLQLHALASVASVNGSVVKSYFKRLHGVNFKC